MFPSCSILRRHPQPKLEALEKLQKLLNEPERFKFGSNKELADSLVACTKSYHGFYSRGMSTLPPLMAIIQQGSLISLKPQTFPEP